MLNLVPVSFLIPSPSELSYGANIHIVCLVYCDPGCHTCRHQPKIMLNRLADP